MFTNTKEILQEQECEAIHIVNFVAWVEDNVYCVVGNDRRIISGVVVERSLRHTGVVDGWE